MVILSCCACTYCIAENAKHINIKQILLTVIFFIIIKYTDYKKITHLFAISTYNISICKGTIFLSKRLSFSLLYFNVCMKNLLLHSLYSRITTFMDSFLPVSRGSFIYITREFHLHHEGVLSTSRGNFETIYLAND